METYYNDEEEYDIITYNNHLSPRLFIDERSTEEKEKINLKLSIEAVVKDILLSVEYDTDYPSFQLSPRNVRRRLFDSEVGFCGSCFFDSETINKRVSKIYEILPDTLEVHSDINNRGYTCRSCIYDGRKCDKCGVSEKLLKIKCDRNVKFQEYPSPSYSLGPGTFVLCPECDGEEDMVPYIEDTSEENTIENPHPCRFCGEFGHPDYECPTGLWDVYGDEWVIDTECDSSLIEREESEKIIEIKGGLKELMDISYDLTEYIPNGLYISITEMIKVMYDKL